MKKFWQYLLVCFMVIVPANAIGQTTTHSDYITTDNGVFTCFSEELWSANDLNRPCAKVTRVYEDGSIRIAVADADGDKRYAVSIGAKDR